MTHNAARRRVHPAARRRYTKPLIHLQDSGFFAPDQGVMET
jgi:hypothetical protein